LIVFRSNIVLILASLNKSLTAISVAIDY